MESIGYILFDLGDTLLYFDGDWPVIALQAQEALVASLRSAGLNLEESSFLPDFQARLDAYRAQREAELIEITTETILRESLSAWDYPDLPDTTLRQALNAMYAVSQSHWKPEPDAAPTLLYLCEQGYRLGILSNAGDDPDVQMLVDKAAVRPYLDFIISSAAAGIRKPDPRIFQMALNRWGARPAQTAMVGDTLGADILGAQNAQIYSIWLTRRADTPANRAHAGTIQPHAVIQTLAELPKLLHSLNH